MCVVQARVPRGREAPNTALMELITNIRSSKRTRVRIYYKVVGVRPSNVSVRTCTCRRCVIDLKF